MRALRCVCLGVILLACVMIFIPAQPVHAQQTDSTSKNKVLVGIYVLNIGRFDLASGSYTIDFYLSMRCAAASCNLGSFEFMNGRASSTTRIENSSTEKFWRIEANLYENLDLHSYPFDSHTLTIRIEDTTRTKENLTYAPDPSNSGLDPSIIIVGWGISGWNQSVQDHYYGVYKQTYSQYVFSIVLDRKSTSAMEIFLPVFFLAFIAMISMLMYGKTSSVFESRILLTASVLVAAVLFQFTLDSSIPEIGYLTFVDKFMIATYGIIIATLVIGIMVLNCHHKRELEKSLKIQHYSTRILPIVVVIVYALVFGFLI